MKRTLFLVIIASLLLSSCGLINKIKNRNSGTVSTTSIASSLYNTASNTDKQYTFKSLPNNVEELKAMKEADMKDPYAVAALTVAALMRYETSIDDCYEMLNYLKGPEELSPYEKGFLRDRFEGQKYYKVRSFFAGATPQNDYTPKTPYMIKVRSNRDSFASDGWATLWLFSSGADNPRTIKLRQKKSTGEWFLNEIMFLSDIRLPASADPWN
ncbi:MAG: hypothetical protein J6W09_09135 [Bacteroidales bacterium]|nr:hypothetical protein [Bacteroidales bacterium]